MWGKVTVNYRHGKYLSRSEHFYPFGIFLSCSSRRFWPISSPPYQNKVSIINGVMWGLKLNSLSRAYTVFPKRAVPWDYIRPRIARATFGFISPLSKNKVFAPHNRKPTSNQLLVRVWTTVSLLKNRFIYDSSSPTFRITTIRFPLRCSYEA